MAKENVNQLKNCVNACAGNLQCVTTCENTFLAAQGNRKVDVGGGKVFYDSAGGKVFINDLGQIQPTPPGY